ncbi:MAG: hypothetical protein N2C14_07750, partial [Planctomycetales bacterium]
TRVVEDEGFQVHKKKTRVLRAGGRQKVTGLVVNGDAAPRVPRALKRRIRAAIHNLSNGKPLQHGDTPATLAGYVAYIHMSDPKLGAALRESLEAAGVVASAD